MSVDAISNEAVLTATGIAVSLFLLWVRWSIKHLITDAVSTSVRTTVNGKIDRMQDTVDYLREWTKDHDVAHDIDQKALIAALKRQGIEPADGWDAA